MDAGTTCLSARAAETTGVIFGVLSVMISSSGGSSAPDSSSQSRRMRRATGEVAASTSSSWISEVSRAAVFARIVATPSRRLSSSARAASVISVSAFTRARSSRTRNAITWN